MNTKKIETKSVEQYHCPNCNAKDSLWPIFVGKKAYLRECDNCHERFTTKQLSKIWNTNTKNTLEIVNEKSTKDLIETEFKGYYNIIRNK